MRKLILKNAPYDVECVIKGFDGGPSSNTDDEASSTTRNSNRLPNYRINDRNMSSSDQVQLFHYCVYRDQA